MPPFTTLTFLCSYMSFDVIWLWLSSFRRMGTWRREKGKIETFKTFIIFKIQPLLLHCSILLSLFTLKTNTTQHARDEKYFWCFLPKYFSKKSPVAETFITCWKIINTLVYISHFTITEIIFHWLWPHIFITGEKPSELNNKWTILIAGNGDNLDTICYSGESSHGMVKHHKHHHHHKQCSILKPTHGRYYVIQLV